MVIVIGASMDVVNNNNTTITNNKGGQTLTMTPRHTDRMAGISLHQRVDQRLPTHHRSTYPRQQLVPSNYLSQPIIIRICKLRSLSVILRVAFFKFYPQRALSLLMYMPPHNRKDKYYKQEN